jgi:hypothetical protein
MINPRKLGGVKCPYLARGDGTNLCERLASCLSASLPRARTKWLPRQNVQAQSRCVQVMWSPM